MIFKFKKQNPQILEQLREYTKDIVGLLMDVYKKLPCGFPEYIYQEALEKTLKKNCIPHTKEYIHHPPFDGEPMESYFRMDFVVEGKRGNIIIECKAIENITDRERHQLYTYMAGTQFPIGIIVNFATYDRAQIERYYLDRRDGTFMTFWFHSEAVFLERSENFF